jgi:hypothetical protein
MTTDTNDTVLEQLVQWHESADQATTVGRAESEQCRDYYDGRQWTAAETAVMKKRKQPVVTDNRIKPKVDFLMGQERERRMMPRGFPRTPGEEEGASAATDSIRYVMDQSQWDRNRSGCFSEFIVEGACGIDVQVYEKPDGEVCIDPQQIRWDRMWWDPHSREPDFSDAMYKGQFIWMDLDDAKRKWPDHAAQLDSTLSTEPATSDTYSDVPRCRWADPKRRRVRIAQCWSREQDTVYFSTYTKGVVLERMESPFLDEEGYPDDGFVFGSCFVDRDGDRYGVVRAWITIQDEINKRRSKALHLMSVRQTFGNQSIGDVNKLRSQLAQPDGHAEVAGGAKFGEDFGVLPTGDMAKAQFELLQDARSSIDAVGVNAALSGKEERVMSGRALIARSEQGLAELGPVFDAFSQFQHDVYRKVWNRVRQFWTAEKWIRVTDDEKNVRFVGLNRPITLGEQLMEEFRSKPGVTPEQVAQAEQQAKMDPAMQQVVGTSNDLAKLDVDIVLDEVPASATLQNEAYEQLVQLAPHMGAMPPPMVEMLIEVSPLRNKEKALKKLRGEEEGKLPPEVEQQMAEQQQHIQELEKELAQAQKVAQQAEAIGPAADLAKREQQLQYDADLLAKEKEIALLRIQLAETKERNAARELQHAASNLDRTTKEANQPKETAEAQS